MKKEIHSFLLPAGIVLAVTAVVCLYYSIARGPVIAAALIVGVIYAVLSDRSMIRPRGSLDHKSIRGALIAFTLAIWFVFWVIPAPDVEAAITQLSTNITITVMAFTSALLGCFYVLINVRDTERSSDKFPFLMD